MKQVTISTPFITLIVLDYGARIQKLLVKDKFGKSTNAVVGYDFAANYLEDTSCLGASIGRYAGRISNASFELDREKFDLFVQHGVHLHGGKEGFHKKYWKFESVDYGNEPEVTLSYLSKHLEEGYPGNLKTTVTYKLINNALYITYSAVTDRTTVVNLTNHSYFKLDDAKSIDQHYLKLNCPDYLETQDNLLPTGKLLPVKGTDYNFLDVKPIADKKLDTTFTVGLNSQMVANLYSKKSGISMEVSTNQPGVVVYTPSHFSGICFETQNFPDAPNKKHFPNSILRPGENYSNKSKFKFDLI
ncbi:galactose mutarotase [Aurantibacter crassamenti]|uniref:aldose epimerase family protein n=1 Tax=Aurantibacter crassamenti TaxID=1837375 RepID=UPI00193AA4D1|nr:aldose epimerase family protein [Aurantibacter crassamenti]MBM1106458.1 galactose mutarotase [Aurantibacter crassamenti]